MSVPPDLMTSEALPGRRNPLAQPLAQIPDFSGIDKQIATSQSTFDTARAQKEQDIGVRSGLAADLNKGDEEQATLHRDRLATLNDEQQQMDDFAGMQPKDQIGMVMQQSPLFLGLMAIAGGLTKQSGVTALGAMNGMVQGLMKGDRQQYADANAQYQQTMETMKQRWAMQDKVYNELEKAYGDTEAGRLRRYQIAAAAVGEDQATADKAFAHIDELNKLKLDVAAKYDEFQARRDAAKLTADARVAAAGKSGAGSTAQTGLSPEAIRDAAIDTLADPNRIRQYASYGASGQAIRTAINNEKTAMLKEVGLTEQELIRQQAIAKAQVKSVGDLVGMQNAVNAYETVASGNGQRVLELVNKVNTTGIPLLNSAKRIGELATGNPDAAELMQVLQNYQTEVARIIANPRLVGQLTDTARKEIETAVPANMTPAQALRIVKRLDFEFELRNKGISDAIAQAQGQMTPGFNGQPAVAAPAVAAPAAPPAAAGATLPPAAAAALKEGQHTTFGNGQVWMLQNGQPVQVK